MRPRVGDTIFRPVVDESLMRVDLVVWGSDVSPTICNYSTVALGALELIRERPEDFIKSLGEIMVREILTSDHGRK